MGVHLQRALVLIEQSRHQLAEDELRQELLADPDDPQVHALLGLCLAEREKFADATQATEMAIHLGPDLPLAHYMHGVVLRRRNHLPQALEAAQEAIRLDPVDPDYHALVSQVRFEQRNWKEALAAAEAGLEFDPEHTACNNLRAMALDKLGRREQAGETVEATLARDPSNVVSHYVQGLLHLGRDPDQAIVHFREVLRLDPNSVEARAGLVEAIKAKNPLYRGMLNYFLWCQRLSGRAQWALLLGGYFGVQFLQSLGKQHPDWNPFVTPLIVAYIIFAWLTWLSYPLFNLLLRFHKQGRLALSPDQIKGTYWLAGGLVLTLGVLSLWPITGDDTWGLLALICGLCVLPVTAVHRCDAGWPRWTMAAVAVAVILIELVTFGPLAVLLAYPQSLELAKAGDLFWGLFLGLWVKLQAITRPLSSYAILGATIAANYLANVTVRK